LEDLLQTSAEMRHLWQEKVKKVRGYASSGFIKRDHLLQKQPKRHVLFEDHHLCIAVTSFVFFVSQITT
jgi:hypothetical protein